VIGVSFTPPWTVDAAVHSCRPSVDSVAARIDKLSILGYVLEVLTRHQANRSSCSIRSFDNTRSETIQFHTPLTLIVGFNGSGKTVWCFLYQHAGRTSDGLHTLDHHRMSQVRNYRRFTSKQQGWCFHSRSEGKLQLV